MYFILFVAVIVLFFYTNAVSGRVKKLEAGLKPGAAERAPGTTAAMAASAPLPGSVSQAPTSSAPKQPDWSDRFVEWVKEDWLLKLGALLVLIGFGWLVTYAFLNNWIGPMGRILLGLFAGTAILLFGWWRVGRYRHQGSIFLALGSTVILVTIFAARELYGFFTPLTGLGVMFLSTAFVAAASVVHKVRSLALVSLILAGIAPLLTNSAAPDYIGLFAYLLVVTLGAIWIVALTGQRELTAAALIVIAIYSMPHLSGLFSSDLASLLLFAYAFSLIFFITNSIGILKLKGKDIIPDLYSAGGNGLLLLAWIAIGAPDEWKSLLMALWMVVFSVGAFLLYTLTKRREPFYVYAGVGIAMLAAATAVELKGATLTIAYTIECGIISFLTYALLRDARAAIRTSLLLLPVLLLSINSIIAPAWATRVLHKDFFVLLFIALTYLSLGTFYRWRRAELPDADSKKWYVFQLVAGSLYAYTLLWLSLHAALRNDDLAVTLSLLVYTVIGLIAYFYGLWNGKRAVQVYGALLAGFVVLRLLLIDVWRMELSGRIVTFFLLGALLISTAFLGGKRKIAEKNS